MKKSVLMQCGCRAQAKTLVCVVHLGIAPGAETPVAAPDLTGREARCSYRHHPRGTVASSLDLAFFTYHPDRPYDSYYCGCWGWD